MFVSFWVTMTKLNKKYFFSVSSVKVIYFVISL